MQKDFSGMNKKTNHFGMDMEKVKSEPGF